VEWLNSPPLSTEALKGKVVLVDFWTYSCINCIRTVPYVRAWADKYKDQGLVVIGVHARNLQIRRRRTMWDRNTGYIVPQLFDFVEAAACFLRVGGSIPFNPAICQIFHS
jgi:thiol-disulfide isomerase/thioredoxin